MAKVSQSLQTPSEANMDRELLLEDMSDLTQIRLLAQQGDWIKLEGVGLKLLLQHPPPYEAIESVAYCLQQGAQLEATAVIATKAAVLFHDSWLLHFLAGVSLQQMGREKEACMYLRRAAAISPNDRETIRQLIDAIAKSNGIEAAASEYIAYCHLIGAKADIILAPISNVRDWAKKLNIPLLEAGEVEEIPFKAPHVWGRDPCSEIIYALSNKPYIAELKNARIFNNSNFILTEDGTALNEAGGDPNFGHIVNFAYEKIVLAHKLGKVLLQFSEFKTRKIEIGFHLSGLASSAFGHWLPEFLPKLQVLQQYPDFAGLPIIVDADMPQNHFDHLRRLVDNPLIFLRANESLLCQRLFIAPPPSFLPVETLPNNIPIYQLPGLSPRALKYLRSGKSREIERPCQRRFFLARNDMRWRRLINESEIAADLQTLGFETIFIEKMSVSDQIDLFQQAKWIVAPNGSALLNLIFANTDTKLVVLTQPNLHNWGTFQGPMDSLGYHSICVSGDYAIDEDQKHSDYHVPLQPIRDALSYLGIHKESS